MFVGNKSGLGDSDRMKVNGMLMADAMGMRMSGMSGMSGEMGMNLQKDVPQPAMASEMFQDGGQQMQIQPEQQMMMMPQQQQMMPQHNPFTDSQFNMSNMPDLPINTPPSVMGQLLDDSAVPDDIRNKYWFVFNKDNALTFLDEERKSSKLLNMDIIKIDILNATPYYDYTFEKELEFDIVRNAFETKIDRALGYGSKTGNQKNERILLQSQFSEQRHINTAESENQVKGGFLRRILSRG